MGGSDLHVEVVALGFRLKFDRGGVVCEGRKIEHGSFLDAAARMTLNGHYQWDVGRVGFHKTRII
jgi:hypothetical protein